MQQQEASKSGRAYMAMVREAVLNTNSVYDSAGRWCGVATLPSSSHRCSRWSERSFTSMWVVCMGAAPITNMQTGHLALFEVPAEVGGVTRECTPYAAAISSPRVCFLALLFPSCARRLPYPLVWGFIKVVHLQSPARPVQTGSRPPVSDTAKCRDRDRGLLQ
jgi:hypothetical protein